MIDKFQNIPIFRHGQVFVNAENVNQQFLDSEAQPDTELPFESDLPLPELPEQPSLKYKIPSHLMNLK
jgi:hypothetical protein